LQVSEQRLLALLVVSVRPSVRLSGWKNWVQTGRIVLKFYISRLPKSDNKLKYE